MKKNLAYILLIFLALTAQNILAQKVEWVKPIGNPSNYSTIVYMGKNLNGSYFYYGKDKYEVLIKGSDQLQLFYLDAAMSLVTMKEAMKLKGSVLYYDVTDEAISLVTEEESGNDKKHTILLTRFNPTTFVVLNQKVLIKSEIRGVEDLKLAFHKSADGSKVLMSHLVVNEYSQKGGLQLTLFDREFQKLWENEFSAKLDVDYDKISLLDYYVTNNGIAYILLGTYKDVKKKADPNYYLHIARAEDGEMKFYSMKQSVSETVRSGKILVTKANRAVISVYLFEHYLAAVYDIEDEELVNMSSTNTIKGWASGIDELIELPNGNIISLGKTVSSVRYENSSKVTYFFDYIYVDCISPAGEVLFEKKVNKSAFYKSQRYVAKTPFLDYDYAIVDNDVFVWYSNLKKNEAGSKKIKAFNPSKPSNGGLYLCKVNEDGKLFPSLLADYKSSPGVFHAASFPLEEGVIGIMRIKQKDLILGKLKLD